MSFSISNVPVIGKCVDNYCDNMSTKQQFTAWGISAVVATAAVGLCVVGGIFLSNRLFIVAPFVGLLAGGGVMAAITFRATSKTDKVLNFVAQPLGGSASKAKDVIDYAAQKLDLLSDEVTPQGLSLREAEARAKKAEEARNAQLEKNAKASAERHAKSDAM